MLLLSGPCIAGNEWKYVKDCLDTAWVSSVGAYVNQFEQMTAEYTGARYAVATSSGTTALHIALLLAGVQPGDAVLVPNLTFVASLNAIKYTGAQPVLIDVHPDTWQMDVSLIADLLDQEADVADGVCRFKATGQVIRAIMPVHVLGNMVEMDALMALASRWHLEVVEDATEALGSTYKGQHAGTFGKLGCFSYNGNKIITTGGGGMIVTNDEALAKKAKHLTTQAKADAFEYFHDEVGYNYRLVNVLAAIGVAQMEQLPGFLARKAEIDAYYRQRLGHLEGVGFQQATPGTSVNHWLFTFASSRQPALLKALNDNKMQSRPFWVPMNQLPMFRHERYVQQTDVSNSLYKTCLSIPCSVYISNEELAAVADTIVAQY